MFEVITTWGLTCDRLAADRESAVGTDVTYGSWCDSDDQSVLDPL